MELVARKADLVRELQFFQQIVERKNTIPILANVLIEATGNEITLLATDLEVTLRSRCRGRGVASHGAVTLPAKKLYEVVRALPDGDVNIETEKGGTGVKVSGGQFSSRMPTLPREDFPTITEPPGVAKATLKGSTLRQMIAKTQFAITGEDTRYYLNGALFVLKPDQMTFVATDGHRLALVHADREGKNTGDEVKAILPRKTLAELGRLLADSDGDVRVRARREPPVLRDRAAVADVADDRRAVPGLRKGHAERQRQAHRVRARSAHQRGPPRGPALERAIARGQVPRREGQGRRDLEQPGVRRSPRADRGGLRRPRASPSASTRSTSSISSVSSSPTSSRSTSRTM